MGEAESERSWVIKRAVGRKLAVSVGAAASVLGLGLFLGLVFFERQAVEQSASDQIGLLSEAVVTSFLVVDERNRTHTDDVLSQLGRAETVLAVDVLNADGEVVKSSRPDRVGTLGAGLAKNLRDVQLDGGLVHVTENMPWTRRCVGCHDADTDPVGAVHIAVSREATLKSVEGFHLAGGLGILFAFAVLVALVLLLSERIVSRPIFKLARVMQKAAEGDFLVRARHASDDELGALVRAFNAMLKSITSLKASEIEREADLEKAREELTLKAQLEVSNQALERRVRAQSLLMEAAHRLSSTLDNEAVLDRLVEVVRDTLSVQHSAIFLVEPSETGEPVLRPARLTGAAAEHELSGDVEVGTGIVGWVAETGAPFFLPDVAADGGRHGPARDVLGTGALLALPMLHKGRVVGVMLYFTEKVAGYDEDDIELLQALASQAAMAVVNADLHQKTVELSVTDALTGLMNRRALERRLELELIRAQRFSMPLCILMIDVDHFKAYNDRMGHLLGDRALVAVARALEGAVRKVDGVARFGGEEFSVFLPRTELEAGEDVAEKLRLAVRDLDTHGAKTQPLGHMSISMGLAVFPDDMPPAYEGKPGQVLLDLADRALYEAKHQGRDRVVSVRSIFGLEEGPTAFVPRKDGAQHDIESDGPDLPPLPDDLPAEP